jgi:hypothetical protein
VIDLPLAKQEKSSGQAAVPRVQVKPVVVDEADHRFLADQPRDCRQYGEVNGHAQPSDAEVSVHPRKLFDQLLAFHVGMPSGTVSFEITPGGQCTR